MLGQFPFELDSARWETFVLPVVGLLSAGLTLLLGRTLLRPRKLSVSPRESPPVPDPFVFGSATEKRISLRRAGKLIKVHVLVAGSKAEPIEGWVIDRSMGGLCLAVPQVISENSMLSVRTAESAANAACVEVQVKHSEAKESYWELGCQFVRTPPWSILLQFG